jgi:hypothetical protein
MVSDIFHKCDNMSGMWQETVLKIILLILDDCLHEFLNDLCIRAVKSKRMKEARHRTKKGTQNLSHRTSKNRGHLEEAEADWSIIFNLN